MRKVIVGFAFAALVVVPTANAKEISAAKVCGASACVTTTDKAALLRMAESSGPLSPTAAPKPAPYYKVTFQVTEPGRGTIGGWDAWYVPSKGVLSTIGESGSPEWSAFGADSREFARRIVAELTPFPTPTLTRVLIGNRSVRDPNSYLALFDPSWRLTTNFATDWKTIAVTASAKNPWTDGVQLLYSPRKDILWRGASRLQVPHRIAANIEARRSLTAAGHGRRLAWGWVAGGGLLVGGPAAASVRRRRK
jgi:hypothetical protein